MRRLVTIVAMLLAFAAGALTSAIAPAGGEAPARPSRAVRDLQDTVAELESQVGDLESNTECLSCSFGVGTAVDELDGRVSDLEFDIYG